MWPLENSRRLLKNGVILTDVDDGPMVEYQVVSILRHSRYCKYVRDMMTWSCSSLQTCF